jgi:hypothetical protein
MTTTAIHEIAATSKKDYSHPNRPLNLHAIANPKMFNPPVLDVGRIERVGKDVAESITQLKLSIEKCGTQLNAAMLRQQTLGIITISSYHPTEADLTTSERRNDTCLIQTRKFPGVFRPYYYYLGQKETGVCCRGTHTIQQSSFEARNGDGYRGSKLRFRVQSS